MTPRRQCQTAAGSWPEVFFTLSIAILLATAILKTWTAISDPSTMELDPLLSPLMSREVMLAAALLETAVAFFIARQNSPVVRAMALTWLCTLFVGYRLGLAWFGSSGDCRCLGSIGAWLHLSSSAANLTALGLLAFMAVGSVTVLWAQARAAKARLCSSVDDASGHVARTPSEAAGPTQQSVCR